MFTLVVAQKLGLSSDWVLGLSVLEGVCLTVVLMLLAERFLLAEALDASALARKKRPT